MIALLKLLKKWLKGPYPKGPMARG